MVRLDAWNICNGLIISIMIIMISMIIIFIPDHTHGVIPIAKKIGTVVGCRLLTMHIFGHLLQTANSVNWFHPLTSAKCHRSMYTIITTYSMYFHSFSFTLGLFISSRLFSVLNNPTGRYSCPLCTQPKPHNFEANRSPTSINNASGSIININVFLKFPGTKRKLNRHCIQNT